MPSSSPTHASKLRIVSIFLIFATLIVTLVTSVLVLSPNASAADAKDFKAGNIIDDYTFYNRSSMTASQVQSFLNSKVPTCDTQGTQSASAFGYPHMTRAQYAAMRGWHSPPYTCMRDYKQDTPQMEASSGLCGPIGAKSNRSAAYIIKDIADACGINPQVLIVLLEKEQSLVTDTWPLKGQYSSATGFACPDTAPCDNSFGGFFYQVYYAARQFKIYQAYPNNYNYIAGRNNRIYYNPNTSCGSSTVYIENQATAGLYNYTPYQPNSSALNNLYGSGNSCGAYGNRNFWRIFTDWFGSTHGGIEVRSLSLETQPFTDEASIARLTIRNVSKKTVNLGRIKVEARSSGGAYYQTASVSDISIKAGGSYTFRQPITIEEEGTFTFAVARNMNGSWVKPPFEDFAIDSDFTKSILVTEKPTVDQSLTLPSSTQHVNAPVTATFRIKNNSPQHAVSIGRMKLEGYLGNTQYDFPSTADNVTIPANGSYTYSQQFIPQKTGTYSFKLMNNRSDYGWSSSYPESTSSSIARSGSITVKDSVTLIEPLELSHTSAHQGENVTATFTVKNFSQSPVNIGRTKVEGYLGRTQYDFPSTDSNLTLAAGEEYTYNETMTFNKNGTYKFSLMNYRSGNGWSENYPTNESSNISRSASVAIKDPVTITQGLSLSTQSSRTGESVTATFTMRNFSNKAINIGRMKVEGYLGSTQYDFPSTSNNLTLQPGKSYTYSESRELPRTGKYTFKIMNVRASAGWSSAYPVNETSGLSRQSSITVKEAVTVTSSLNLSASSASPSDTITATFTLRNHSSKPVNIGRMKVEGRVGNTQYDFGSTEDNLVLQPGEEYDYSESRTFPKKGTYSFTLANYRSWAGWSLEYPVVETGGTARTASLVIR